MLQKLLGLPCQPQGELFDYLPLAKIADEVMLKHYNKPDRKPKDKNKWAQLEPNEDVDNVKDELVMLKLRNLVDHTKFKRGQEVRKLPTKIQKGVVIQGDGFELKKLKKGKRHNNVVDYFLEMDKTMGYSTRKFSEVQRVKQRRKRIKKRDVKARKRQSQT